MTDDLARSTPSVYTTVLLPNQSPGDSILLAHTSTPGGNQEADAPESTGSGSSATNLEVGASTRDIGQILESMGVTMATLWTGSATFAEPTVNVHGIPIAAALVDLYSREISRSREMLSLEDDWDGEGSPGYSQDVWRRAAEWVIDGANELWTKRRLKLDPPQILPGPDGSVDVRWAPGDRVLLANVPPEQEGPVVFYGDDGRDGREVYRGSLKGNPPSDDPGYYSVLLWLIS